MFFQTALVLFLSILEFATAQGAACGQISGYKPAIDYCAVRYPVAIPTVTITSTKTVTVTATSSLKTTTKATTTSSTKPVTTTTSSRPNVTSVTTAPSNSNVRTITAVVEVTVTNCSNFTPPPCTRATKTPVVPGFNQPTSPNLPVFGGRFGPREAEPEPQFGRPNLSGLQALFWARILGSGNDFVKSMCSCVQPAPSRTATVSTFATITATVRA